MLFFSTSLDDAIARCSIDGQGGGQHFNLGSSLNGVNGPRYSVEASPIRSSVYEITGDYYVHCDAYLRSEDCGNLRTPGPLEDSSRCRRERAIVIASSSNTISSLHSIVSTVLSDNTHTSSIEQYLSLIHISEPTRPY